MTRKARVVSQAWLWSSGVGDGLVDQQPGRLVELGVAEEGGGHELPGVGDVLEPAGELL